MTLAGYVKAGHFELGFLGSICGKVLVFAEILDVDAIVHVYFLSVRARNSLT